METNTLGQILSIIFILFIMLYGSYMFRKQDKKSGWFTETHEQK